MHGMARGALSWVIRLALSALIMWLLTRSILYTVLIPCVGVSTYWLLQRWVTRLNRRHAGPGT